MRALVLSGGGAKGAWQAGVIERLLRTTRYDVLCGTSVGAIHAAFLAQHRLGDEAAAGTALIGWWRALRQRDVYRSWFLGPMAAAWKLSLYDAAPLATLLRRGLDPAKIATSGHRLRVGAVSLRTGCRRVWTEHDEDVVTGVLASASMPVAFQPVAINGDLYTDGGIADGTPLADAIEAGADTIDCVLLSPENPELPMRYRSALDVGKASLEVMLGEIERWDLRVAEMVNNEVAHGRTDRRRVRVRVLRPSKLLGDALDFSPTSVRERLALGSDDAAGWV